MRCCCSCAVLPTPHVVQVFMPWVLAYIIAYLVQVGSARSAEGVLRPPTLLRLACLGPPAVSGCVCVWGGLSWGVMCQTRVMHITGRVPCHSCRLTRHPGHAWVQGGAGGGSVGIISNLRRWHCCLPASDPTLRLSAHVFRPPSCHGVESLPYVPSRSLPLALPMPDTSCSAYTT